jgi:hypothetical protein
LCGRSFKPMVKPKSCGRSSGFDGWSLHTAGPGQFAWPRGPPPSSANPHHATHAHSLRPLCQLPPTSAASYSGQKTMGGCCKAEDDGGCCKAKDDGGCGSGSNATEGLLVGGCGTRKGTLLESPSEPLFCDTAEARLAGLPRRTRKGIRVSHARDPRDSDSPYLHPTVERERSANSLG